MAYTSSNNGRGGELTYVEQVFTATGTATIKSGLVIANSATAITITLPAPDFGGFHYRFVNVNVGVATLRIVATTANAHTVTQTTPGFNNASTSKDVATFGGAIGDNFSVVAYGGVWHVLTTTNVTIA